MTLQLTIKNLELVSDSLIPAPSAPKNKVSLNLRSMIGDADGYNNEFFRFSPDDERGRENAHKIMCLLEAFADLGWNEGCDMDSSSKWEDLYATTFGGTDDMGNIVDFMQDLIGYDPMYEQMATPDSWNFTYFDDKGDEHRVNVTVDGKPMKGRRGM